MQGNDKIFAAVLKLLPQDRAEEGLYFFGRVAAFVDIIEIFAYGGGIAALDNSVDDLVLALKIIIYAALAYACVFGDHIHGNVLAGVCHGTHKLLGRVQYDVYLAFAHCSHLAFVPHKSGDFFIDFYTVVIIT